MEIEVKQTLQIGTGCIELIGIHDTLILTLNILAALVLKISRRTDGFESSCNWTKCDFDRTTWFISNAQKEFGTTHWFSCALCLCCVAHETFAQTSQILVCDCDARVVIFALFEFIETAATRAKTQTNKRRKKEHCFARVELFVWIDLFSMMRMSESFWSLECNVQFINRKRFSNNCPYCSQIAERTLNANCNSNKTTDNSDGNANPLQLC